MKRTTPQPATRPPGGTRTGADNGARSRRDIRSAALGGIVIGMVANGLGLLNVVVGTQYVVTGIVLLAASTLDSLSRRRTARAGRT
jgi:ABC-type xylose transport system permease subunit